MRVKIIVQVRNKQSVLHDMQLLIDILIAIPLFYASLDHREFYCIAI